MGSTWTTEEQTSRSFATSFGDSPLEVLYYLFFQFISFLLCSALLFSSCNISIFIYVYFIGLHIMGQYNGNAGYPPTAITENVTYAYNTVYGTNLPPSPSLLHPLLYLPYFISLHFISYVSSYFAFITFLFRPVNFLVQASRLAAQRK